MTKTERQTEWQRRARRELKEKMVAYMGGECRVCGYSKSIQALQFHHLDPSQKDFHFGGMRSKDWEKVKSELDKCVMLCANCHIETHEALHQEGRQ